MANNRLYIVDTESGERILLAKSNGRGWWIWYGKDKAERLDQLSNWLELRDRRASYGNTDKSPSKLRLVTENEPDFSTIEEPDEVRLAMIEHARREEKRTLEAVYGRQE